MTIAKQFRSPFNDQFSFNYSPETEQKKIDYFIQPKRNVVVVMGLGFVGTAMCAALAAAEDSNGQPLYSVIGVDLADENNYWKIGRLNEGKPPVYSSDERLEQGIQKAVTRKNLMATYAQYAFSVADVVVVDINLDVQKELPGNAVHYNFTLNPYIKAIRELAQNVTEGTVVIIESTVPPGTTEQVIYPEMLRVWEERGLNSEQLFLAHSYERVMPGKNYLHSITDYYRVFAGINPASAEKARFFLTSFINTKDYPLTELHSTTASEMAKVLENSYRAMNIAFMQEWTELAEKAGVNLFEVIEAIRKRKTHQNIMAPGFGVGGYCLTKDSLLADWAAGNFFDAPNLLKMSVRAIDINDQMPEYTFKLLQRYLPDLNGAHIALFGVSYLNDVADTRHTPAGLFYDLCKKHGTEIFLHDPMVRFWEEKKRVVINQMSEMADKQIDAAVFAVRHSDYLNLNAENIRNILPQAKLLIDANNIINNKTADQLRAGGIRVIGVGKGHWKKGI